MQSALEKKLNYLPDSARRELRASQGLDFCGNDYLGLSQHPRLKETIIQALRDGMPVGATGARLIRGNHDAMIECEAFCANYFGSEAAIFVESGFKANYLLLSALPQRREVIIYDERVHASMHEGIHASQAKRIKVPNNDLTAFEAALKRAAENQQLAYIVVESLYSMDGDYAPLYPLYQLCNQYQAILIVDEAHATGIFGGQGKGLTETLCHPGQSEAACWDPELQQENHTLLNLSSFDSGFRDKPGMTRHSNLITLHMGGKALGVSGAVICCSQAIKDQLVNFARPFIFSTAPWPLQALAFQTALQIIADEPERRAVYQQLMTDVANLLHHSRAGSNPGGYLPLDPGLRRDDAPLTRWSGNDGGDISPIIPIILGSDEAALQTAERLQQAGYDVRAIRPPTVPEGTSRLRLTVQLGQKVEQWRVLLKLLINND